MNRLSVGKLPPEMLRRLLSALPRRDPRVRLGPQIGHDAAVIDFGEVCLVAKSDPITFATDEIGFYAVNVNANDIFCHNALPRWFLATVLLPEHAPPALAQSIFEQIARACDELEVALVGGHTEVTHGLDRPIVSGHMLGEVERERLVAPAGLRPGDAIVLTKGVPLEGVAIIARERGEELVRRGVASEEVERFTRYLHEPGISVAREARALRDLPGLAALHDPTEGGVATALWELAQAAGVGLDIDAQAIPLVPGAERACAAFGLDPLGTISSGALLVGLRPHALDEALARLCAAGVVAAHIGFAVDKAAGVTWRRAGRREPIPVFPSDEIARIF